MRRGLRGHWRQEPRQPLPPISLAILLARFEYFRNLQSHRHGRMSASRAKFPSTAARLERQIL